jgi:hypothetical protein
MCLAYDQAVMQAELSKLHAHIIDGITGAYETTIPLRRESGYSLFVRSTHVPLHLLKLDKLP